LSESLESLHYGGRLLKRDDKHKYTLDGEPIDGVTSILEEVNDGKSNALKYWGADTFNRGILSRFPESGNISIEDYEKNAVDARKELKWSLDDAASIGGAAHKWIEEYIKNKLMFLPPPPFPYRMESARAVEAFLKWEESNHVHFQRSELLTLSLNHMYAGQMDLLASVNGNICQVDFKTSNGFRDVYRLQTAAYSNAYEEEHGVPLRMRFVLMLGKDTGKFDDIELSIDDYEHDLNGFISAIGVYRWVKRKNKLYPRKRSRTQESTR